MRCQRSSRRRYGSKQAGTAHDPKLRPSTRSHRRAHPRRATADVAAAITDTLAGISVADAHIGAAIRTLTHVEVVLLASDPGDITRVAGDRPVRTVHV
jgi:hypothetical protein